MNGNGMNGNGHGQPTIQVNPVDVAKAALQFMQRVQFHAAERASFDAVEALLTAIANQQLVFTQPNGAAQELIPQPQLDA
jgi:hypothetical protein